MYIYKEKDNEEYENIRVFEELDLKFNIDKEVVKYMDSDFNGNLVKEIVLSTDIYLEFSIGNKRYKIKCEEIEDDKNV